MSADVLGRMIAVVVLLLEIFVALALCVPFSNSFTSLVAVKTVANLWSVSFVVYETLLNPVAVP